MYDGGIKPVKFTAHICSTQFLRQKTKERVILQRKFNKLIDAKFPLRSCFFVNALSTEKKSPQQLKTLILT